MAKNFNSGIDRVFSPTVKEPDNVFRATVKELDEKKEVNIQAPIAEPDKPERKEKKSNADVLVSYNLRYPKELKKRIKRFCIENEGIDMKDVFTQGAILFMEGKTGK